MNSPYTLLDVVRVLLRHKFKFLFVAAMVFLSAVIGIRVWPRSYASEAILLVRLGRESVTLDPTANTGTLISVQESRQNEINSARELLSSRALLESVVARLGIEKFSPKANDASDSILARLLGSVAGIAKSALGDEPPVSNLERIVTRLHKKIDVSTTKRESDVIIASCVAKTPDAAQEILQALIDEYLEQHVRINNDGSFEFFEEQTRKLAKKLATARTELKDEKNNGGIASLVEHQASTERQIADLQKQAYVVEATAKASLAKIDNIRQLVAEMPERLELEVASGFDNQAADDMKAQLFKLQIKELDFQSRYTEQHPIVATVREQANKAANIVDQQSKTRTRQTTALNPTREKLSVSLATELANSTGLQTESKVIKEHLEASRQELRRLNEHEVRVKELESQIALLDASYKRYHENLEQARINDALEKEKISNIGVAQPPTYVAKPIAPRKLRVLLMSLFAAVFAGFAVSFLAEQVNHPLTSRSQVEKEVDIPVLVSIPRIEQPAETRVSKGI